MTTSDSRGIWEATRAAIDALADMPEPITEPIKLTRFQLSVITDETMIQPDPPWRTKINEITGRRIEIVETVEESTPYLMDWLPGRA